MKLREEHIIKAGGAYHIDEYNIKWIILDIGSEMNQLLFYNCGDCFNVYLANKEKIGRPSQMPIQLCLIRSRRRFKQLVKILKYDGE